MTIKKSKIYTRTGDKGETSLWGGGRVRKDSLRISACGTVDELNVFLGWIRAENKKDSSLSPINNQAIAEFLLLTQNKLFSLESLLTASRAVSKVSSLITQKDIRDLERRIDRWEAGLKPLKQFIVPGDDTFSARLHIARVLTRRAERFAVALNQKETLSACAIPYLNRLSDAFFVLARWAAKQAGAEEVVLGEWNQKSKRRRK